MKILKIVFISFFLAQVIACSPSDAEDKTENKETASKQEMPKGSTPPPNIVVAEDDALPIDKRGGNFTLYSKNGAVSLADYKGKVVNDVWNSI